MELFECIMSRRSVRSFTGDLIDEADVEKLLRAAMAAPSAGNQRPWRFVLLEERDVRVRVAACSPYAKMLPDAALGIVVCGETAEERHPGFWVQGCSAAVQNMLLAARAMGLGAVWLGFHPDHGRAECCREVLGLPDHVVPMAVIALGHPAEGKPPADRYDPGFVHRDRW